MTLIGWNTPRDILENEAENDNPEALLFLGKNYEIGANGSVQDNAKSSEYFQRGAAFADQGSPAAQLCLGHCYRYSPPFAKPILHRLALECLPHEPQYKSATPSRQQENGD